MLQKTALHKEVVNPGTSSPNQQHPPAQQVTLPMPGIQPDMTPSTATTPLSLASGHVLD